MRTDGKAEVQHYVPQALLRLHVKDASAKRGSEQVWCFDKKTERVFSPNIKGVLSGSRFYEVEIDGQRVSLEEPLTKIEEKVSPILARLVRDRKLAELRKEERRTIAAFCAVQLLRTPAFRERIKDMNVGVADALRKRGIDPSEVSNFKMLSEDEIKGFSIQMLAEAPQKYGPHFLSKYWHLIEGAPDDPFHLGDHPVVVDNDVARGRGSMGLASPGVTIYLPLSPTLCLAMTDPQLIAKLFAEAKKVNAGCEKLKKKISRQGFTARGAAVLGQLQQDRDRVNEHIGPLRSGAPGAYNGDIVMRVNSLQMIYASRWIISSKDDFSLPLRMIADDATLKERRKLEVE
jgi:hypothetical protein